MPRHHLKRVADNPEDRQPQLLRTGQALIQHFERIDERIGDLY